ncbi:MAG: RecB family exonuclease [Waddliaceae bacterium]
MIYSHSRLDTYRQCPYKFRLNYIDHIPSSLEGIEAFMGSRVHEVLQKLYTDLRFCKEDSLETLLQYYRGIWEKEWHENIRIVREDLSPDEYFKLGERCIVDYYHRYKPFDQNRTLGIEHPIQFSLDKESNYQIKGFVDRISQPKDKVVWIHDYKTKGFFPTQQDLDEDRQLAYYQMAVSQLWPDTREIELIWHFLIFDQEVHSRRTVEELEALRKETIALIQEIEAATHFPPKQSGLCNWCEYQSICPLFSHLHEASALSKNEYLNEEGVQLAHRLVALQAEENKLKEEISKVKDALWAYAEKKGVEVVFTKEHKVRIKVYENIRFPGKKDPSRSALEKAVKDGGKWEEVSLLDVFALSKVLQKGGWDRGLVEKIKQFGSADSTLWIKAFPRNENGRW